MEFIHHFLDQALNDVLNCVSEYESVLSVFESKMNKLHTTHSWDFLGLETISKNNPKALDTTSDVIVGVIDSGKYFLSYYLFSFILITMSDSTLVFRHLAGIGKLH